MKRQTTPPDPTSSLLAFFGSELRRLRTKAGLSQRALAVKAHTTQSMLSKVEAAKQVPSVELADDFDLALGTDGHFGRLHPLVLRYAYPSWFLPYVELEEDATSIHSYESQIIHGLLQTEEYAQAMLEAVRPDNIEDLVTARISRQCVFEREDGPYCWFILDEYALCRHIGGVEVMRGQLEQLLRAGERPRTVIQVIPQNVPAHAGLSGPFAVLGFEENPDVLFVDGFSQGRLALETAEVEAGARAYDLLRAVALSPEASAELIGAHLEGLRS
ncbi:MULTISPECIES: helix-turn-helix transcriptional regulator [unclassified Streptomyces]|uniref:helix-turn-helix domain-containing protein n=1 Tax=unclassified Streptomyces TaxID=2593676 RepID=UPI000CD58544|nr:MULTISPECIES: helix-turn-helix transcriptional regulator [unclassified Streptomyces]